MADFSCVMCPNCLVQYPVDARAVAGSQLECKRCGHVFPAENLDGAAASSVFRDITRSMPAIRSGDPAKTGRTKPAASPVATPPPDAAPARRRGKTERILEALPETKYRWALIAAAVLAVLAGLWWLIS